MTQTEQVEFKAGGETLKGKLFKADESRGLAVLLIHGWTGSPSEATAKALADNGFSAMTFSLSGHNDSSGRLQDQTRQKSLGEVLAAYDFFKTQLPAGTKIGAVGTSYGGYLTAVLCGERPIACAQLRVPANYPDESFDQIQMGQGSENAKVMGWRLQPLGPAATKSLAAIHAFSGPVQIIEAELDDHVPHQTVQNYVEAVSDTSKLDYHFMKGWPHSLGDDPEHNRQYQEVLLAWLNRVHKT